MDKSARSPRYRKRLRVNRFNLAMSLAAMAFGMAFLLWILAVLVINGFAALSPTLFTQAIRFPSFLSVGAMFFPRYTCRS